MPFNSFEYLTFFIVVLACSWMLYKHHTIRIAFLLLSSWYFYASNNGWLLALLMTSTLIDYAAGLVIEDNQAGHPKRKLALVVSLFMNLGMLGFFKYFGFFVDNFVLMGDALGLGLSKPTLEILLPVGISFYTFQSMSYSIDVYRGKLTAERSFLNFAFYVSFFPQLVAGPIVSARYFLPQIPRPPKLTLQGFEAALFLIAVGLIKKIVLGDTLGDYADMAFNSPESVHAFVAWLGLFAFTFQIYFDFSGYTDVAIGCALLLGYRLPLNFKRPYVAVSFSEFWRRWHISLSFWLREYLYKPLGGNRHGSIATYKNLILVMLLGGLWHGAAWTFVVWGLLHGSFLAIERLLGQARLKTDFQSKGLERFLRSTIIFVCVSLAWLPFRASDFGSMMDLANSLFQFDRDLVFTLGMAVASLIILGGYLSQWIGELVSIKRFYLRLPLLLRSMFLGGTVLLVLIFSARGVEPFIYFRF